MIYLKELYKLSNGLSCLYIVVCTTFGIRPDRAVAAVPLVVSNRVINRESFNSFVFGGFGAFGGFGSFGAFLVLFGATIATVSPFSEFLGFFGFRRSDGTSLGTFRWCFPARGEEKETVSSLFRSLVIRGTTNGSNRARGIASSSTRASRTIGGCGSLKAKISLAMRKRLPCLTRALVIFDMLMVERRPSTAVCKTWVLRAIKISKRATRPCTCSPELSAKDNGVRGSTNSAIKGYFNTFLAYNYFATVGLEKKTKVVKRWTQWGNWETKTTI